MTEKILAAIAQFIIAVISASGYWGVMLLMGIESACIPLPSEIIMPFAGYLVHVGKLSLVGVATAGALGCNLGSLVAYWVGAYGGRPLVERFGKYVLLSRHDLDRVTRYFERWGGITVFFARWLPGLRIFGAWIAGMVHMKWWKFALWNAAGGIVWTTSIVLLGHFFGKSIHVVERVLGIGGVVALIAVAIAALVLWRRHERGKAHALETQPEGPKPPELSES